jgi:hypothetical protein
MHRARERWCSHTGLGGGGMHACDHARSKMAFSCARQHTTASASPCSSTSYAFGTRRCGSKPQPPPSHCSTLLAASGRLNVVRHASPSGVRAAVAAHILCQRRGPFAVHSYHTQLRRALHWHGNLRRVEVHPLLSPVAVACSSPPETRSRPRRPAPAVVRRPPCASTVARTRAWPSLAAPLAASARSAPCPRPPPPPRRLDQSCRAQSCPRTASPPLHDGPIRIAPPLPYV